MFPTRVLLAIVLMVSACSTQPTDSVGDFVDRTIPDGPGGTVVAARGGEIIHCAGFGLADRAARIPATCDTAYDVMSITKQFTAAAILKLEVLGELRVDDPISAYLDDVPADKRGITVHHLLTHTAGLVDALGDDYAVLSRDDLLAGAMASELDAPPGTRFQYSNLGYSVLAAIIEIVSGLDYEQFLARHLFAPAGMTSTGYVLPHWAPGQLAVEYDAAGVSQGRPNEHPWAADGPYWNLRGNGGILSTARDLVRWHHALTDDTVLPAPARRALFTPHTPLPDQDGEFYGYGWVVSDTEHGPVAWHDGGNSWSLANLARSTENGTMAFFVTNQVARDGAWNLADLEPDLTLGILDRARPGLPTAGNRAPAA